MKVKTLYSATLTVALALAMDVAVGAQAAALPPPAPDQHCSIGFNPPVFDPEEDASLVWSSTRAETCELRCGEFGEVVEVPGEGIRHLAVAPGEACRLKCSPTEDAPPDTGPIACEATLPDRGTCPAPSCAATVERAGESGFELRFDSEAELCSYSCEIFGAGVSSCGEAVPLGTENQACRVWALNACGRGGNSVSSCTTRIWTATVGIDGDPGDWPPGTAIPTNSGTGYLSWDDEHLYLAMQDETLSTKLRGRRTPSMVVYLGTDQRGQRTSLRIGSQQAVLPTPMQLAVHYSPQGDRLRVYRAEGRDSAWSPYRLDVPVKAAFDGNLATIELAIARSLLPETDTVYLHMNLIDSTPGAEVTFGAVPQDSHADVPMTTDSSIYKAAMAIDLSGYLPPNSYQAVPLGGSGGISPPEIDTMPGPSLRLMTFNVAQLDIPLDSSELQSYIALLCGEVSPASFLGLAFIPAGFFVPPDPPTFAATCVAIAQVAMGIMNDRFEEEGGGDMSHDERATVLAGRILAHDPDVVVINEAFVESARDQLVMLLHSRYPHVVERLKYPAQTDLLDLTESHFGAYFVQDSGLMLFSKFPFLPLSNTSFLTPDSQLDLRVNGNPASNLAEQAVAMVPFEFDCRGDDCMAAKAVALVRIEKSTSQRFAVAFTHMQAGYGSDDVAGQNESRSIRGQQLASIRTLLETSLTPQERTREEVFVMGDLNVVGRQIDGAELNNVDFPDWDPAHEELTADPELNALNDAENRDWDLGRQEWLHHFCGLRTGLPDDPCDNSNEAESQLDNPASPGYFACGDGGSADCTVDGTGGAERLLVDSWAYDSSPHDVGRSAGAGMLAPGLATCSHIGKTCFDLDFPGCNSPPFQRLKSTLCAGERLDYVLRNEPATAPGISPLEDRHSLCAQHHTIAYEVSGAGGTQPLSDHLPVHVDVNRYWHHCRPKDAKVVGKTELGTDNTFNFNGDIKFEGSMQWFVVTEPGSYSIGVSDDSRIGFRVYADEDLSRPRPSYHELKTDWGMRYELPSPPYYVRVFASPDGGATRDRIFKGNYHLTIHLHDCTSAMEACTVMAGGSNEAVWPDERFTQWNAADPHHDSNPDGQWFIFTSYSDDDGRDPQISFEYETRCIDNYRFEVVEYCSPAGPCPSDLHPVFIGETDFTGAGQPVPCEDCDYAFEQHRVESMAPAAPPKPSGKQFFLRVLRTEPFGPGCTVGIPDSNGKYSAPELERTAEVRFGTDLTFFYPDRLQLRKSEDDWGDYTDELWFFAKVNALSPKQDCDSCDGSAGDYQFLGEVVEGGPWFGIGGIGTRSFVENLQVSLYSEATPGDYDTDEEWFVPQGGRHACPPLEPTNIFPLGFSGICPLAEDEVNVPVSSGPSYFWYADERDLDDADYDGRMHYCMTHEWVGPPAGRTGTLVDNCRAWSD